MSTTAIATISTADLLQRFTDDVGLHLWNVLTDEVPQGRVDPGLAACAGRSPRRRGEPLHARQGRRDRRLLRRAELPGEPAGRREAGGPWLHPRRGLRRGGVEAWKQAGHGLVGTGATA